MAFRIDILPRDVVRVVFSGTVTVAERFQAMQAIVDLHRQSNYAKLLADFSQATVVATSTGETNAYATRLAHELPMHRIKIAYVGNELQAAGVEAIAALRGYFYQRFPTVEIALRWLG